MHPQRTACHRAPHFMGNTDLYNGKKKKKKKEWIWIKVVWKGKRSKRAAVGGEPGFRWPRSASLFLQTLAKLDMIRDKETHLPRLHTNSTKAEEPHRVLKAVSSGCLLPQNMKTHTHTDTNAEKYRWKWQVWNRPFWFLWLLQAWLVFNTERLAATSPLKP